jgi:hypothetical protein
MHRPALRGLLLAIVFTAAAAAHAEAPAVDQCPVPASKDPMMDRAGLLAAYERMPRPCLQALFTACSDASSQSLLDFGSAAVCSLSYEALLRQGFHGDFGQLMAWWRSQKTPTAQD